jgi:threonine synthase
MTTATLEAEPRTTFLDGLRCRNCGHAETVGPSFVCPECFGPLEVVYDLPGIGAAIDRDLIAGRGPGIWRYRELLPVDRIPDRALPVGSTPLVRGDRLGAEIALANLWIKDDTRNPTLSFKDRVVAVAAARAVEFGFDTLACASTGNLAGATAAAAAALGLRAFVFVPADLEQAKIDQALGYGATVIPVQGTYDDVNRLSLEIADEEGWAFVNVNLRPFYAEGSKSLAFEIAEQLGWRLPDAVIAPMAGGSLVTKLDKGFHEFLDAGLVEGPTPRIYGAQATGCAPIVNLVKKGGDAIEPVQPRTIARSIAIGNPADGRFAAGVIRASGGDAEAVTDEELVAGIRLLAETTGVFTETAGGVTVAAARKLAAAGRLRPTDELVLCITGNGLKTLEAVQPALPPAPVIAPKLREVAALVQS